MSPSEKPRFTLPPDKAPTPAMEGREVQADGRTSDRRFHEDSMATGGDTEEEDLAALREFIQKT